MLTALLTTWEKATSLIRRYLDYILLGTLCLGILGTIFYLMLPQTEYRLVVTPLSPSDTVSFSQPAPEIQPQTALPEETTDGESAHDAATSSGKPKKSRTHHPHVYPKKQLSTVNVNQANAAQLQNLPGVGPKMAIRILEYRKAHGAFQTAEALSDVKGIGEKTLAKMRPYLKF